MSRFFFDIHDGGWSQDAEGVECADVAAACYEAKQVLPRMAAEQVLQDEDRHAITVLVTDEDRRPVYTATLSFAGLVLKG